jgi:hypothetical protein
MQNRNIFDNSNTFNFLRNSSSRNTQDHETLIDKLTRIKNCIIMQRDNYVSETDSLLSLIDSCMHTSNSIETTPMTNDEIIQYTASRSYGDILNPLNSSCPLSRIIFTNAMIVCKLPCGHLFDGPTICFRLSHMDSLCPRCHQNVRLLPVNRVNLNIFSS